MPRMPQGLFPPSPARTHRHPLQEAKAEHPQGDFSAQPILTAPKPCYCEAVTPSTLQGCLPCSC